MLIPGKNNLKYGTGTFVFVASFTFRTGEGQIPAKIEFTTEEKTNTTNLWKYWIREGTNGT